MNTVRRSNLNKLSSSHKLDTGNLDGYKDFILYTTVLSGEGSLEQKEQKEGEISMSSWNITGVLNEIGGDDDNVETIYTLESFSINVRAGVITGEKEEQIDGRDFELIEKDGLYVLKGNKGKIEITSFSIQLDPWIIQIEGGKLSIERKDVQIQKESHKIRNTVIAIFAISIASLGASYYVAQENNKDIQSSKGFDIASLSLPTIGSITDSNSTIMGIIGLGPTEESVETINEPKVLSTYTVISGDTLWGLRNKGILPKSMGNTFTNVNGNTISEKEIQKGHTFYIKEGTKTVKLIVGLDIMDIYTTNY